MATRGYDRLGDNPVKLPCWAECWRPVFAGITNYSKTWPGVTCKNCLRANKGKR